MTAAPRGLREQGLERLRAAAVLYARAETEAQYRAASARLEAEARALFRDVPLCTREGCRRREYGEGLCWQHWWRRARAKKGAA